MSESISSISEPSASTRNERAGGGSSTGDFVRARGPGLPPRVLRAARSVAEGLFAREEGPPPAERLVHVERELDDFFANVTLRARLLFRACLAAVFWLAPLLLARLPPLSRLSVPDRVRALNRLEESPLSIALLGAKALLSIVYFEHPDAAREIGWDQRCLDHSPTEDA